MLVLTRKTNESIMIGDDIELTVIAVEGEQVKLGIKAPKHVSLHRKEVYLAIQQENDDALQTQSGTLKSLSEFFQKKSE